jgi:aromatic-L-amino-acid/L-tryptophan decarboxylase
LVALPSVVIVTQPSLSRFTFAAAAGDDATDALLARINDDGWICLAQTKAQGRFVIRVKVEQFGCTGNNVAMIAPWLWN